MNEWGGWSLTIHPLDNFDEMVKLNWNSYMQLILLNLLFLVFQRIIGDILKKGVTMFNRQSKKKTESEKKGHSFYHTERY
jgi:hypothetical protein